MFSDANEKLSHWIVVSGMFKTRRVQVHGVVILNDEMR